MKTRQLWLDLTPKGGAFRRETFVEGQSNAMARKALAEWQAWPGGLLTLTGPAGCGKSHLGHLWAAQSGATACHLNELPRDLCGVLWLDDTLAHYDEAALFRLINAAAKGQVRALLSARTSPRLWPCTLPDLTSRLAAMHTMAIEEPDDAVLTGVLLKLFADRQINPAPSVLPFLLQRMERSTLAALETVQRIHALGHDRRQNIRLPLVRTVLAQMQTQNGDVHKENDGLQTQCKEAG